MKKQLVFEGDGWCSVTGDEFKEENVIRVAKSFSEYLISNNRNRSRVAVGFDGRQDSETYARLVANVLAEGDFPVLLSSGIIPTPVLSFATKQNNCTAGIMVTGGHNAPEYNGLKFRSANGAPFNALEMRKVALLAASPETSHPPPSSSHLISIIDFLPAYISNLRTIVDFSAFRNFADNPKNIASVLIDSMGGAGQSILEDLFIDAGWRAQTIFGEAEPDFFDRSPESISENLDPLKYNVGVTDTALGIATDGDAGCCGIVYDNGDWMEGQDSALALFWHLWKQKGWRGGIAKSKTPIDSISLLAENMGAHVFYAQADFSSLSELMVKEQCMFAADERGGFAYRKHTPDKDGILTGLLFAEMISIAGKSIREIVKEIRSVRGVH